jgi:hypothetical protein
MTGSDRQLLSGVRLLATREDRIEEGEEQERCSICRKRGNKGIVHLVTECDEWTAMRRRILGPNASGESVRKKWIKLTTGTGKSMRFLKELARGYKLELEEDLMPWVGYLGSRRHEGAIGMCEVIKKVAKWIDTESIETE